RRLVRKRTVTPICDKGSNVVVVGLGTCRRHHDRRRDAFCTERNFSFGRLGHTFPLGLSGSADVIASKFQFLSAIEPRRFSPLFSCRCHSPSCVLYPLVDVRIGGTILANADLSFRYCSICLHASVYIWRSCYAFFPASWVSRRGDPCRVSP